MTVQSMTMENITEQAARLRQAWQTDRRQSGIRRDYTANDVIRLRQSIAGEDTLAPDGLPDAFALMKSMIEAGADGVLFDDLLPGETKRGHLGGKILIPTGQHIKNLNAARLAADVLEVPALIIARTHAHAASLLTSDADERDHEFLTGERTPEGFHRVQPGRYARATRGLAFAPYADLLWLETTTPSLAEARAFATVIYSQYPDQLLAYSCSPSFSWRAHLDDASLAKFGKELAALGYRFQPGHRGEVPLGSAQDRLVSFPGDAHPVSRLHGHRVAAHDAYALVGVD